MLCMCVCVQVCTWTGTVSSTSGWYAVTPQWSWEETPRSPPTRSDCHGHDHRGGFHSIGTLVSFYSVLCFLAQCCWQFQGQVEKRNRLSAIFLTGRCTIHMWHSYLKNLKHSERANLCRDSWNPDPNPEPNPNPNPNPNVTWSGSPSRSNQFLLLTDSSPQKTFHQNSLTTFSNYPANRQIEKRRIKNVPVPSLAEAKIKDGRLYCCLHLQSFAAIGWLSGRIFDHF